MRRRFARHPRGYAGDRPIRLWNDDQLSATVGVLLSNEHRLPAPRVKRIENPPLDRVLMGSMSLFRAGMIRISVPLSRRCVAKLCRGVCTVTRLANPAAAQAERQAEYSTRTSIGLLSSRPGKSQCLGRAKRQ